MQCVLIILTSHTCPFAPCEACVQLPLRAFLACQAPFIPTLFSHKYLLLFLSTTNVFVGFSKIELSKAQRSLLCSLWRSVHKCFSHYIKCPGSVIGGAVLPGVCPSEFNHEVMPVCSEAGLCISLDVFRPVVCFLQDYF